MKTAEVAEQSCNVCSWDAPAGAGVKASTEMNLNTLSESQRRWGARTLRERLRVLRATRLLIAERAGEFAAAISPALARNKADTLMTEVLPLLDACRFLEREAEHILKPKKLGRAGRPLWLGGVWAEVYREPLGHVLVIGPSNFPLFLPGAQVLQALAAGNAVTWKPGAGGVAVAELMMAMLRESGLPKGVLQVTGESVAASEKALAKGADKVVFTGSAAAASAVLGKLAATATPAVMELSGADALVVLPSADLARVVKAVAFGLRLNGGAVCMSPRRLFATTATLKKLRPMLDEAFATVPPAPVDANTAEKLRVMLKEAVGAGASFRGAPPFATEPQGMGHPTLFDVSPIVLDHATVAMAITKSDLFAPVISLIETASMMHVPELHAACGYGLTVAVFGDEAEARTMAKSLRVGSVLINDVIVPTADPRVPFGGRGESGYGVTRGAEGLLEMTAVKTLLVRRGKSTRHLETTTEADAPMFEQLIRTLHGETWAGRWKALRALLKTPRTRKER